MTVFAETKESIFVKELNKAGFEAYFVGGAVRDLILRKNDSFDIDIATSATPEDVANVLGDMASEFDFIGSKYGVIIVDGIEIAQYRKEIYNNNGDGKPMVQPTDSLYDDAKRRDFTINSIYLSVDGFFVDPYNGREDLKNGIVRTVGNPDNSFKEDASRILRMFYLAARFNFRIDPNTLEAAKRNKGFLSSIPVEMKGRVLKKVLDCNCLSKYVTLIKDSDMLSEILPEIAHTPGLPQNPKYHCYDVFDHIVKVIEAAEKHHPKNYLMLLSALNHDRAKGTEGVRGVNKDGQPNDLGHEEAGYLTTVKSLIDLQFGKDFAEHVGFIVRHHGLRLPANCKQRSIVNALRKMAKDVKSTDELRVKVKQLFNFMHLDAEGFNPDFGVECREILNALKPKFDSVLDSFIFFIHELPINGNDLIALGYPKGKIIRDVLEEMLIMNIQDKDQAIKIAQRRLEKVQGN